MQTGSIVGVAAAAAAGGETALAVGASRDAGAPDPPLAVLPSDHPLCVCVCVWAPPPWKKRKDGTQCRQEHERTIIKTQT